AVDAVAREVLDRHGPAFWTAVPVADLEQVAHHVVISDLLSAIFAAADRDRHRFGDRADPDLAARDRRLLARGHRDVDLLARERHRHRHAHHPGALVGVADRILNPCTIATDDVRGAVDDDLRRVDLAVPAHARISALTRRETRIRQRVLPAEI